MLTSCISISHHYSYSGNTKIDGMDYAGRKICVLHIDFSADIIGLPKKVGGWKRNYPNRVKKVPYKQADVTEADGKAGWSCYISPSKRTATDFSWFAHNLVEVLKGKAHLSEEEYFDNWFEEIKDKIPKKAEVLNKM